MKTYIGPYVCCTGYLNDVESFTLHTCTNKNCKNHMSNLKGNFCEICGSKVEDVTDTDVVEIDISMYDYTGGDLRSVTSANEETLERVVWIENRSSPEYGEYLDVYELIDLDQTLISDAKRTLERFKAYFEPKVLEAKTKLGDKFEYSFGFGIIALPY